MFLLEELGSQGSLVPGVVEKPGGGLTFVPAPDLGGSLCGWPLRAPADRPMAIAFAIVYGVGEWEIYQTDEVAGWMGKLRHTDPEAAHQVEAAVDVLSEYGPTLGR